MLLRKTLEKSSEKIGEKPKTLRRSPERKVEEKVNGKTMLFGSLLNLQSIEHWEEVMKPIIVDITNYLIKGVSLSSSDLQIDIRGLNQAEKYIENATVVEAKQTLRLIYCNKDSQVYPSPKKPRLSFLDENGEASKKAIFSHCRALTKLATTVLLRACVGPMEYLLITDDNICNGYVSQLETLAKDTIAQVRESATKEVVDSVIDNINEMSLEQRRQRFRTSDSENNDMKIASLNNLKTNRE